MTSLIYCLLIKSAVACPRMTVQFFAIKIIFGN